MPAEKRRWLRILAMPPVLLGVFVLLGSLALFFGSLRSTPLIRQELNLDITELNPQTLQEVPLVLIDANGLEDTVMLELSLAADDGSKLAAILAALRELMLNRGTWPQALLAPQVFVTTLARQRVAVLDFDIERPLAVTIEIERQILESVRSTTLRNGMDKLQILINGKVSPTFLGHLALETSLD